LLDEPDKVQVKRLANGAHLHQIQTTFGALVLAHVRLIATEASRQIDLRDTGLFSSRAQTTNNELVSAVVYALNTPSGHGSDAVSTAGDLCQNGLLIFSRCAVRHTFQELLKEFQAVTNSTWRPSLDLEAAAAFAIESNEGRLQVTHQAHRARELLALISAKFRLNRDRLQALLDGAATQQVYFNYHEKAELAECFDFGDVERFTAFLREHGLSLSLRHYFDPISRQETVESLSKELDSPTIRRKDARDCDPAERRESIFRALFGGYIFRVVGERPMHEYLNPHCRIEYKQSFYEHLTHFHPNVVRRDCALAVAVIDPTTLRQIAAGGGALDALCGSVASIYQRLANYCFFGILIQADATEAQRHQWQLFSKLVLFAERFKESPLKAGYFRPGVIEETTARHIPGLDTAAARFHLANEGFLFRDCFVLPKNPSGVTTFAGPADLLLIFEKSERDESIIPCPACRSTTVAGNSYPTLGVRSWECENPLCPSRSAFDRGNRYSVQSLLKQHAIDSDADQIPNSSLKKWKLDVVAGVREAEVIEMLVRHFSLHGDQVLIVNATNQRSELYGRAVRHEKLPLPSHQRESYTGFTQSAFFKRWLVDREIPKQTKLYSPRTSSKNTVVYQGDCFEVLHQLAGR
jgi:hypothetical protein